MDIIEKYTLHNKSSRKGSKIDTIVIHHTGAWTIRSTVSWFMMKKANVSAHYIIDRDGKIIYMVAENMKAWHAGYSYFNNKYNVNNFSIGIELVGDGNMEEYTKLQIDSLVWLSKDIMKRYPAITVDRIVSHSQIRDEYRKRKPEKRHLAAIKTDPGKYFDWELLRKELKPKVKEVLHIPIKKKTWHELLLEFLTKFFSNKSG